VDEKRHFQKELFEDYVSREKKIRPGDFLQKNSRFSINLNLGGMVFMSMGFIIALAVVFSIGVERGRSMSSVFMPPPQEAGDMKEALPAGAENHVLKQQEDVKDAEETAVSVGPVEAEAVIIFTVQVASYTKEEVARKHADQLKAQGDDAFVLKKGDYYIICNGRFKTRRDADTQMKRLRKTYRDCIIRKI
jgi:septal ring-binding cell division protein DamX